jgi:hypothetical protein
VKDFRVIDYESVSMLAVSALQEETRQRINLETKLNNLEKILEKKGILS